MEIKKTLITFDMDGVLVDVSQSYRETVRQTARLFLTAAKGGDHLPDPLFSLSELATVKQGGGLNNDWDLTHRVIQLLYCQIDGDEKDLVGGGNHWEEYRDTLSRWDVSRLIKMLDSNDKPLSRLMESEAIPDNRFVARMFQGDVGTGNIIKQIFQEVYLGPALFEDTYGMPPLMHKKMGLNHKEKLIIPEHIIINLSKHHWLSIATGRPRAEAIYPLKRFHLQPYFKHVLTLDDCLAAEKLAAEKKDENPSFSKPHPFMLDTISQMMGPTVEKRFYVGDMPDDMIAASRSKAHFTGIGFTGTAPNHSDLASSLLTAGASHVFFETEALVDYFDSLHG